MSDSREQTLITAALDRGYLTVEQIAEARARAQQEGAVLLQVLAAHYLRPEQVATLRALNSSGRLRKMSDSELVPVISRNAGTVSQDATPTPKVDNLFGAIPQAPDVLGPGDSLGGYVIERALAQGGMGAVYIARDPKLDRRVALKVMLRANARARIRFLREAVATAKLHHPNVVAIHDSGEENDRPYLVMDLVEGESLRGRIDREGTVEEREAARITVGIARGMAAAHDESILHRDLKPANVLIDERGEPRVTDFGLATFADDTADSLTKTGQMLGTPAYMAPEQAKGDTKNLDARTDVYAIGAILYDLLTGTPPFVGAGGSVALIVMIIGNAVESPSSRRGKKVDRGLEAICLRCLAKAPADRYPTAHALAEDIDRWLDGERVGARRRAPLLLALPIVVFLGIAAVLALRAGDADPSPTVTKTRTPTKVAKVRLSPRDARGSKRLAVITSSPDPKHQLEGVRRWLVDFDPHPQRAEALKLRAQVCLVVPVLSLTHPNTLCKKASIVKDKYALTHGGGVVVQWSLEDGREVNRWEPNACSAVSVAVHPKGKSFAVSGKGKTYLISLSGKKKPRLIYDKRTGTRLAWSPSGKMLALTGDNGRVAVLKLRKKKLWKLHRDYAHHRTPLLAVAFASETLMVSASGPSLDRKWKGGGGESASCAVVVVDVSRKDKKPLHRVDLDGPPMCLAVEGTKSYVVGCVNNHLRRYALQGDVPSHEFLGEGVEGAAHHGQVRGVSVSGNWIASTSGNDHLREHNELRIWDAKTGVELAHMLNRPFRLQSVQFAPDGRSLLVGGPGGAEYWDLGGLSAPD